MGNTNYIDAEIYIRKVNVNKDIRIINSFDNYKREHKPKDEKTDNI